MKKYILSLDAKAEIKQLCSFFYNIEEGYLSAHDKVVVTNNVGKISYTFDAHYLTPNGEIKLTFPLTEENFNKLVDCVQGNILAKTRYVLQTVEDDWFVDMFKNEQDDVYFIIAMRNDDLDDEEDRNDGGGPPSIIQELVLKTIEENDKAFTDKRLANESYATKKLNVLLREKNPVVKKVRNRRTKNV